MLRECEMESALRRAASNATEAISRIYQGVGGEDFIPFVFKVHCPYVFNVLDTDDTYCRCRVDFDSFCFIVEAYVTADERCVEVFSHQTHSLDGCLELP